MTARVGSVEDNKQGGWYTYRATKAAVNSLTRTFDWQLRTRSSSGKIPAFAVAYHPGTVKTDFSKEFWAGSEKRGQLQEVEAAAERMLDVILGLKLEQRGRLWDWKGNEVPP
jgi:NAD(P)-dependent dehydrogenase (short-subunit alcohol dehydrogenase family)